MEHTPTYSGDRRTGYRATCSCGWISQALPYVAMPPRLFDVHVRQEGS